MDHNWLRAALVGESECHDHLGVLVGLEGCLAGVGVVKTGGKVGGHHMELSGTLSSFRAHLRDLVVTPWSLSTIEN